MPLLSPPPPPAAPSGGSSRRLGSRIRRRRSRRNWAALPLDALLYIFHKLDHVDLMLGAASRTCRSWRSAAREPELWRRIDLRGYSRPFRETISLDRMARLAIWFSAGQCVAFMGEHGCVDGELLLFLAER
ncbi:F-box protein SKIP19-like [Lolium rigidum]|uniref:F-box protein SKIP19-like n=1 Tax=Lolium rigidum TaxID=89674 RepID=UPI001F5D7840|nr:F-box protein SKIP19-like [Lolium rigidum]